MSRIKLKIEKAIEIVLQPVSKWFWLRNNLQADSKMHESNIVTILENVTCFCFVGGKRNLQLF